MQEKRALSSSCLAIAGQAWLLSGKEACPESHWGHAAAEQCEASQKKFLHYWKVIRKVDTFYVGTGARKGAETLPKAWNPSVHGCRGPLDVSRGLHLDLLTGRRNPWKGKTQVW